MSAISFRFQCVNLKGELIGSWEIRLLSQISNFQKYKRVFTFYVIPLHWHAKDNSNLSLYKTRTYLFYIVNIMVADVLATQGARASATMVLT